MTSAVPEPSLKIVGLEIEGLLSIRKLAWPKDGMGWGERVPDMVLVGGVKGSGKTTLLEFFGVGGEVAGSGQCTWQSGPEECMD